MLLGPSNWSEIHFCCFNVHLTQSVAYVSLFHLQGRLWCSGIADGLQA